MNKSKFLKRSLAAILAILMVVAMVPSALAAHVVAESVPTARAAVDPGYNISVNGNKTEWDAAAEAYTAKVEFIEGAAVEDFNVSMIEVSKTSVTVAGKDDIDLGSLGSGLTVLEPKNAVQSVDSFGAGTYTYTLTAVTTDDNGDDTTYSFKLIVTATMKVNSTDASIKAIKTAKLFKIISAKFDNEKNTIELVKALGAGDDIKTSATGNAALSIKSELQPVFIPNSDSIDDMTYDSVNKKLTVTAQNGDKKIYKVSFTEEPAFDTFKLGDYEGKAEVTAGVADQTTIVVDLPYSYKDGANSIDDEKINKLVATWTTEAIKVTKSDGTTAAESGKLGDLTFTGTASAGGAGTADEGYLCDKITNVMKVQTKKSALEAIDVKVRVPNANPEAKLTKIQIGANNQIVNIPDGQTTVNVTMPYESGVSSKSDLDDTVIKVWGSTAATVELARDFKAESAPSAADGNGFSGDGSGVEITSSGVDSGSNTIDISKTVYINVKSEDEKTTTLYTINVNPGEAGASNRVLKSLEFTDPADDDKVVATGDINGDKVTITVPFATGIDPWDTLADLEVRAVASESAKIKVGNNAITADDGSAVAAKYTATLSAVPSNSVTTDDYLPSLPTTYGFDITVGKVTVKVTLDVDAVEGEADPNTPANHKYTVTPKSTVTLENVKDALETALTTKYTSWTFASVANEAGTVYTITATAKNAGAIDGDGPTADDISGNWSQSVEGLDGGRTPTSAVNTNTLVDYDEIVTLTDILDADTDESGPKCITIPTAGVTGDPAKGNQFKIKVYYGTGDADNEKTEYTVTINKKAPSTAGTISSVKVTDDDDATRDDDTVSYSATPSGSKQNGKIVVAPLPYALSHSGADAADSMRFSELKVSENAKVYILENGTLKNLEVLDTPSKTNSDDFTVYTSDAANWTKDKNEIKVYVFSEKDWDGIDISAVTPNVDYDEDRESALKTNWATIAPTTLYKMSASYIAAEDGSKLTNIASTLDENVKVAKGTNTYTITVPNSYVKDDSASKAGKGFTLNFVPDSTSKLATIAAHEADGSSVGDVTSDEGDTKKQSAATKFVVVKADDDYVLKTADAIATPTPSGNAIGKFIVTSESGKNTSPYDIVVKVAAAETSNTIESITVDGTKAVLGDDGETWTLTLPYGTTDMVKLIDIKTVSKLATVKVDNVIYDKDLYYDLGADLAIEVAAESGPKATYTLKTVVSTEQPPVEDPSDNYTDIPAGGMGDWVKKAINYGIMGDTGTDADGKLIFAPQETTQRRWFALMVARADIMAADKTITDKEAADKKLLADYGDKEPDFTDTANEADTAKAAIAYCQEKGIMNGDAGKFNPAGIVNRMEAASILANWLELPEGGKENTHDFKDWDKIPDWAKGNINAVADEKIMNGHENGTFGTENLTRVQTAVIMVQAYERLAGITE